MTLPTALAPTATLATSRVERIIRQVASQFDLKVTRFYLCEPSTCDVMSRDKTERWVDGMWGAELRGSSVNLLDLSQAFQQWRAIHVEGFTVRAEGNQVVFSLGLYGRVMR